MRPVKLSVQQTGTINQVFGGKKGKLNAGSPREMVRKSGSPDPGGIGRGYNTKQDRQAEFVNRELGGRTGNEHQKHVQEKLKAQREQAAEVSKQIREFGRIQGHSDNTVEGFVQDHEQNIDRREVHKALGRLADSVKPEGRTDDPGFYLPD